MFPGPVELEAGGQGRDPDLPDRGVRGEDELAVVVLEDDVQDSVLLLGFKGNLVGVALFFGEDEGLLQGFKGLVGFTAKGHFIEHEDSVAGCPGNCSRFAGAVRLKKT